MQDESEPSDSLRKKGDPRNNPNWRPRGPKTWRYSWEQLGAILRARPATVRRWVWAGKLDPGNLEDVFRMALERRAGTKGAP